MYWQAARPGFEFWTSGARMPCRPRAPKCSDLPHWATTQATNCPQTAHLFKKFHDHRCNRFYYYYFLDPRQTIINVLAYHFAVCSECWWPGFDTGHRHSEDKRDVSRLPYWSLHRKPWRGHHCCSILSSAVMSTNKRNRHLETDSSYGTQQVDNIA